MRDDRRISCETLVQDGGIASLTRLQRSLKNAIIGLGFIFLNIKGLFIAPKKLAPAGS